MLCLTSATSLHQALGAGVVLTAFGFGFRHGIDWDHIAALTDITSSQDAPRTSVWLATLYAFGHALVVFVLGVVVIVLAARLPAGVDGVSERVVGATLVVLAIYVVFALVRRGRDFRMRSRWMLLIAAAHKAKSRFTTARGNDGRVGTVNGHHHGLPTVDDPFASYSSRVAFAVGMIHGVGAETPTQVLIFATAAGVAGRGSGLLLLVAFVVGLLTANTAVALAGTAGFAGARRDFRIYVAVSLTTALASAAIGLVFLIGHASTLPALFGG
jgi:high-affinity nickel-transport protein